MSDSAIPIALCCYKGRAVIVKRCRQCKAEYACPEFKTKAAVLQFNAMIPPSMLLAPLPIELWPNMCPSTAPRMSSPPSACASSESADSPVRRLVSTLGLPVDLDAPSE